MELATLLTACAALLTSFITMLTVREMRKQRVVSHLPIIKLIGGYVCIDIDEKQLWSWENESLQITNFGKGVALDVKVKWEAPMNEVITMLKKYDPHNVKNISLENNILKLDDSVHFIKIQSEIFFPAITENTQSSNEIKIPPYLTTAFGKYINEALINRPEESKVKSINFQDFPTTNIKISYKDINNNVHEKNFSLSIGVSTVQKGSENKKGDASIVFDVHEEIA